MNRITKERQWKHPGIKKEDPVVDDTTKVATTLEIRPRERPKSTRLDIAKMAAIPSAESHSGELRLIALRS